MVKVNNTNEIVFNGVEKLLSRLSREEVTEDTVQRDFLFSHKLIRTLSAIVQREPHFNTNFSQYKDLVRILDLHCDSVKQKMYMAYTWLIDNVYLSKKDGNRIFSVLALMIPLWEHTIILYEEELTTKKTNTTEEESVHKEEACSHTEVQCQTAEGK